MEYKDNEEIMKLVKYIKEINEQLINPNEKIRNLLTRIQKDYMIESSIIERASVNWDNSQITSIENIDIRILYGKLPTYNNFLRGELAQKCTKELYDEIVKREKLN